MKTFEVTEQMDYEAAELLKHARQISAAKMQLQFHTARMGELELLIRRGALGQQDALAYLDAKCEAERARCDLLRHMSNLRSCAFSRTDLGW